jgi:hypothetical protein
MAQIINNQAAFTGTAPNTWVQADGTALPYEQDITVFRANAAVTAGQWVMFVAPTATNPLSITPGTTTAADATLFAGISLDTVVAGKQCRIVTRGFAMGLMETGGTGAATAVTAGSGQVLTAGLTTAGSLAATATIDATLVASRVFGILLGAKLASFNGSALYAPVWVAKS